MDDADVDLVERLADPLFQVNRSPYLPFMHRSPYLLPVLIISAVNAQQGRFVDVPAFLAETADEQVIHKGALADRYEFAIHFRFDEQNASELSFFSVDLFSCSINELCEEIFEAKHSTNPSSTQPFSRRLLLQTLPLQNATVKAHLLAQVLAEQAEHSAVLQSATPEVVPNIDALDTFRQETSTEIKQSCDQMADAILARVLIETVADLGRYYDLTKLLL